MNEAAIRHIDALIRHGAKLPLNVYIMLREAEKRGFEVRVLSYSPVAYSRNYTINVTIEGMRYGRARKLTVDQLKFTKALGFESRAYPHSGRAAKNSSKTIWLLDTEVRPTNEIRAELEKITLEERKLQEERDDLEEFGNQPNACDVD